MTDNKRLALARAAGFDAHINRHGTIYIEDPEGECPFDPEHNSDQFVGVLAWALVNGVNIRSDNVFWYPTPESCRFERIDHDGTAAGLRKAVTEAGMRVVG